MNIYGLLLQIVTTPDAIKPYRDIRQHYLDNGKTSEANAFDHLIEKKFAKNAVTNDQNAVTNDPSGDQE